MASMASSLAGTPHPREASRYKASAGRRALRCNASAVSDKAAADLELGYPFVKIVGQEELKLALTLNVVVRLKPVCQPLRRTNTGESELTPIEGDRKIGQIWTTPSVSLSRHSSRRPIRVDAASRPVKTPVLHSRADPSTLIPPPQTQDSKIGGA